jgi:hypothetical protein
MNQTFTFGNFFKGILLSSFLLVIACKPDKDIVPSSKNTSTYDKKYALDWYKLMLEIGRYAEGFRPPVQARALGYIGLTGYEAAVSGMPNNNSLADNYLGLRLPSANLDQEYNWAVSVNAAYATIFKLFYPELKNELKIKINLLETANFDALKPTVSNAVFERSKAFGTAVAQAIYDWSATDTEGHLAWQRNHPIDYVPPVGNGLWKPTYPDFTRALLPNWGKVRQFAVKENDKLISPPMPFSEKPNSPFYKEAKEVYTMTTSGFNTDVQWLAEFWSDDNFELTLDPATHFISITNQVLEVKVVNLEKAVYAYAKVGIALADAGICCWNSKYHYNLERPVSYIRRNIDANWVSRLNNPLVNRVGYTPPFPAYPSGHSTFGAAACGVLESITGNTINIWDKTHEGRTEFAGKPRFLETLQQAAEENAYSRIPLGVHFRMDCDAGMKLGKTVVQRVNSLNWEKKGKS